ncbi:hypothetical protein E2R68_02845 [Psychromonas sp. RZ22]|uniref:COG3014 family protein n=1 Tax=Psychromonas algarum TaxID=2555643 RepID=UPI001067C270|nr:hypothetical protein [Psychromonas sp. RZ22]TEW56044.1 hypothetical protein E2R68_02845 [Psychromonas sp. RZ22]
MHKILIITLFVLLSTGCSLQQYHNNELADQLQQQKPEKILSTLQEKDPGDTDIAQYYLNLGYLQLLTGQFDPAIKSLTHAEKEMQSLAAISVTENVAAGTVNETFRKYSGYPTDRVMVHNMLALSYLFNNDIEGARVEMLQADVAMKKLVSGRQLNGQLASTHLLSAMIYELLDERSNAFISYQSAESILTQRKATLPEGLKLGLLRMSKKMGNDQQYAKYSQKFPSLVQRAKTNKQVFSLYFDGVVSNKVERTVMVPSHDHGQLIRISMPAYDKQDYRLQRLKMSDGQQQVRSDVIENIDSLAREDLDREYPSILLLTTTRAIAKYELVQRGHEQSSLVGTLLNIATVLSEIADLRSWNMLPATIQFSYLDTNADNVIVSSVNDIDHKISLSKGTQHVILTTSLTDKVFHYQQ